METNKTKSLIDNAIAQLEAQLKAGKSEALKRMLEVAARFHRYSFRNQLLISMQRPDATHVAGFHAWRKLGRFVKKGEKGIVIIAPIIGKKRDDRRAIEEASDEGKGIFGFRGVYVFDVKSTEGEPLAQIDEVQGDPASHLDALKRFAGQQSITVEYRDELDGAQGLSVGGSILILTGLGAAEEFATLAHELAHELLHRNKETRRESKTVRETEAEAVAFVVCTAAGLSPGSSCSDYIQLYQGDTETLATSLTRIQTTAARLIDCFQAGAAEDAA